MLLANFLVDGSWGCSTFKKYIMNYEVLSTYGLTKLNCGQCVMIPMSDSGGFKGLGGSVFAVFFLGVYLEESLLIIY